MKQSKWSKKISYKGKYGLVTAEIIATMNYKQKTLTGTHAGTHDDYTKNIPVHKVESFVMGSLWQIAEEIQSENSVFSESARLIKKTEEHIQMLGDTAPVKSFTDNMNDLFHN